MATVRHKAQIQRWKELIQDRLNSKLKIHEWCEENSVSVNSYYYWLNQIRKEIIAEIISETNSPDTPESNSFVEFQPVDSPVEKSAINESRPSAIIRGNGFEVELFEDTSSAFIKKLMEVIRYA